MKLFAAAVVVLALVGASAQESRIDRDQKTPVPAVRVGVFDSRAVAIVWVRSDAHAKSVARLVQGRNEALAAGDAARVRELEAEGRARQDRLHRQGFSTEPVDDILAHVEDELPAIAARAGVDVIVSKWRIAYRTPGVELLDVTDLLVQAFDPDEDALRSVRKIAKRAPLSLYETDWDAMRDE